MSYQNCETYEIISDNEFEKACSDCRDYFSEGNLSSECNCIKEECPFWKKISDEKGLRKRMKRQRNENDVLIVLIISGALVWIAGMICAAIVG